MDLLKSFREHPTSVGETYGEHFRHATGFGIRMVLGGFACMIHGFLPFLFVRTGSKQISTLHDRMVVNRAKGQMPAILDFVI